MKIKFNLKLRIDLKNLNPFFLKTQNSILSAAIILGIASGINAVLGLLKGRLLTQQFGVSNELAIFFTADRIPNLVYSILIVGAVSTVFIPVFSEVLRKNEQEANEIASSIINATFLFFLILGGFTFIFAKQIIQVLALGQLSPLEIDLGTNLMRVMIASQIILVSGSLISSILQTFKYFVAPALAPIAYNVGLIMGIIFLSKPMGIYGPAMGVLIGSLLHFAIQIPFISKTNFNYICSFNFRDKSFKKMLSLIPPRILSVLISNIIQTINNSFAILISQSSVIYLKYATQLQSFPVNLFGVSLASASLPTLSNQSDDNEKFKRTFLTALHQMLFLVMPLSIILLILRVPAIRLIYGVSNFPWEATIETSVTLGFYSLSIFAQSSFYLLTRAFYAKKDTKTPVFVSIFTSILNIILSYIFVKILNWGVWSVALSFTITSVLDAGILLYLLDLKVGGFDDKKLFIPFTKISVSTILMGITLYFPMKILDTYLLDTTRTVNLLILTFIAGISGVFTYLFFTWIFKVEEIEILYKILRRLEINKKVLKPEIVAYSKEETI